MDRKLFKPQEMGLIPATQCEGPPGHRSHLGYWPSRSPRRWKYRMDRGHQLLARSTLSPPLHFVAHPVASPWDSRLCVHVSLDVKLPLLRCAQLHRVINSIWSWRREEEPEPELRADRKGRKMAAGEGDPERRHPESTVENSDTCLSSSTHRSFSSIGLLEHVSVLEFA